MAFLMKQFGLSEDLEGLDVCKPFLKNTTTYYLTDMTTNFDSEFNGSKIAQFVSLLVVTPRLEKATGGQHLQTQCQSGLFFVTKN